MATFDLTMNTEDFTTLAMAAHLEGITLNEYLRRCLVAAAEHDIQRLEENLSSAPERQDD